jgi:hypothetical protein
MADAYFVQDSYKTTQVASGTQVVDVQYITCLTIPTGIGFAYAMIYTTWQNGPPYDALQAIAVLLEDLVTSAHVVAGQAVQDLDANGLLADYVDLIVELDRSAQGLTPLQGTVSMSMPFIQLWAIDPNIGNASGQPTPSAKCAEEYARLQALAGAGAQPQPQAQAQPPPSTSGTTLPLITGA